MTAEPIKWVVVTAFAAIIFKMFQTSLDYGIKGGMVLEDLIKIQLFLELENQDSHTQRQ